MDVHKDIAKFIKKRNIMEKSSFCDNGLLVVLLDTAMENHFFSGFINNYTNLKAPGHHKVPELYGRDVSGASHSCQN